MLKVVARQRRGQDSNPQPLDREPIPLDYIESLVFAVGLSMKNVPIMHMPEGDMIL